MMMNNGFGRQQGSGPYMKQNNFKPQGGGLLGNNPGNMRNNGGGQATPGGRWQGTAAVNQQNMNNQNNNRQFNNNRRGGGGGGVAMNINNRNVGKPNNPAPSPVQSRLGPATNNGNVKALITAPTADTKKDTFTPPPSRPVLMRPGQTQEKITIAKKEIKAPTINAASTNKPAPTGAQANNANEKKSATPAIAAQEIKNESSPAKNNKPGAGPNTVGSPAKVSDTGAGQGNFNNRLAQRLGAPQENAPEQLNTSNSGQLEAPKFNQQNDHQQPPPPQQQQQQQQANFGDNSDSSNQQQNNYQNKQANNNNNNMNRFGGGGAAANNNRQNFGGQANRQNRQNNQNRPNNNQNRQNNNQQNQQQYGGGYNDNRNNNRQNDNKNHMSGGNQQRRSAGGSSNNYSQDKFWERVHDLSGPQYDLEPLDMAEKKFNAQSRLFVGSLARDVTLEELKEMFSKHGELGQVYYNKEGGYSFINFDYHNNAEKAVRELNNFNLRGRLIKVRFAAITTGVKVRNLPPSVTNELLFKAFSVFGTVEMSRVVVDDRGKPTGDGIVLFTEKKSAVMAFKKCQEHAYFLTSELRPVIVEPWEMRDDEEGYPEASINKNDTYRRDRKMGPRFAAPNSAESDYAKHWKQLFDIYKEKKQALENDLKAEMEALEVKMQLVVHQQETEKLRKELAQREQEARQLEMGLGMYGEPVNKPSLGDDQFSRGSVAAQVSPGVKRPHDYYEQDNRSYDRYGGYESTTGGSGGNYYRGSSSAGGAAAYDRLDDTRQSSASSYPPPTGGYGTGYSASAAIDAPVGKQVTPSSVTSPTPAPGGYDTQSASGGYDSLPTDTGYGDMYSRGGGYDMGAGSYESNSKRGRY